MPKYSTTVSEHFVSHKNEEEEDRKSKLRRKDSVQ